MELLTGVLMVGSAGVCVGGSLRARSVMSLIAGSVMLVAMIDHVVFGLLPGMVWAMLLTAAGLMLATQLRGTSALGNHPPVRSHEASMRHHDTGMRDTLSRASVTTSALAYIAMAWLFTAHGPAAESPAGALAGGAHSGHGSTPLALELVALALITALAIALIAVGVLAVRRRSHVIVLEAWAMTLMLVVMMVPAARFG